MVLPAWPAPQIGPDEARAHIQPYIPASAVTLRTQVEIVEVPVVVRDRRHQAVGGLHQSDFSVYDSGKKQEITGFSVETFVPGGNPVPAASPATNARPSVSQPANQPKPTSAARYVVICFDDIATEGASLILAKKAARQFVTTALAPGDRVAVVTTAFLARTEFTADIPTLLALIEKVQPNSHFSDDVGMDCPPIKAYEAYLISNHRDSALLQAKVAEYMACAGGAVPNASQTVIAKSNAIWERARENSKNTLRAIDDLVTSLASAPGRRMILLASSGFLTGNLETDEGELITKALHAGVVINALSARGLYAVVPGGDASESRPVNSGRGARQARTAELAVQNSQESAKDDGMAVLSSGTGGMFFHNNNDLLRGFRELGMVPEVIYVLSFAPSDAIPNGRFHELKVRLTSADHYTLQARMGYNAPPKPVPIAPGPPSTIDSEMMGSDILADLPARITWQPAQDKSGVDYTAHIDLSRLQIPVHQDRHARKFTLVAVLRDAQGRFVAGERGDVDINLTDANFTRLAAEGGLHLTLTVKAPPGVYSVRGLLLDEQAGKMVTSSQEVRLP